MCVCHIKGFTYLLTYLLTYVLKVKGVLPLRGGTPFRQIFLSRNGAPVNIDYHSRNADTAAFRQISPDYKKLPYTNKKPSCR